MRHNNTFTLTKERRQDLISEIKDFFLTEREETIGDLAAGMILDFFMEKLAPEIYNQGIYDAHRYIAESAEDLLSLQK
ncbi:MAG: DUF2164 domain-containing protein [Methanomicrobiales archaeon]|nr:DUF2164 domain-containing protein [Methanomicrobiales archaeon]